MECQAGALKKDLGVNQDGKRQEKDPRRILWDSHLQQEQKLSIEPGMKS